ncbi:hypothetical protein [Clostridium sp.]|uniref:hypothetical protein n=1 Tax=Clostridium sp. TaxID=1506 RepID=UPI002FC61471
MKNILVIIDGNEKDLELRDEIIDSINSYFSIDFKKNLLYLDEMNLRSCLGCFNCWVKTPGKCIINDKNEVKNELFVKSDYIIFVSKINYGMYSSTFKVALDRLIPNLAPFFKMIDGEMHHKRRYKKDFKIFTIGYSTNLLSDEKITFEDIVKRNMINLHSTENKLLIIENNNFKRELFSKLDLFCGGK